MGGKALGGRRVTNEEAGQIFEDLRLDLTADCGWGMQGSLVLAGSYRRGKPTCGDLDIVICPFDDDELAIFDRWCLARLGTQKSGKPARKGLIDGVQVEFYMATPLDWGTQVVMWTGSARFNVKLRRRAKKRGYSLSQYGFKNIETDEITTCSSEQLVFDFLSMEYVRPEDR